MPKTRIFLGYIDGRKVAASMIGQHLDDLLADSDAPLLGTIYHAVVDRRVRGHGGSYLRTPHGSAFLRGKNALQAGTALPVQVTGYARDGKATPVTSKIIIKGRFAILTPSAPGLNVSRQVPIELRDDLRAIAREVMVGSDFGVIVRTAAHFGNQSDIASEIAQLRTEAEQIFKSSVPSSRVPTVLRQGDDAWTVARNEWTPATEVISGGSILDYDDVAEAIEATSDHRIPLAEDAYTYLEATRALVAVDVNTGASTSLVAGLKANLAAARTLPASLRVRGLGGQIVIDLAPMRKHSRPRFEDALREAFRTDRIDTMFAGWTPLGNYEIRRKDCRMRLGDILV